MAHCSGWIQGIGHKHSISMSISKSNVKCLGLVLTDAKGERRPRKPEPEGLFFIRPPEQDDG